MKVYNLKADMDNYQNLIFSEETDYELLDLFDGTMIDKDWKKPSVKILFDDHLNKNLLEGDFPFLSSHVPVFSKNAISVLEDLILPHGEILSLNYKSDEYFAYNVTSIIDALDHQKSVFKRFKSDGSIMDIIKYIFKPKYIEDIPIFKLPQTSLMDVFITDVLYKRITDKNLLGFNCIKVWEN